MGLGCGSDWLGAGHRGCVVPVARRWPRDHRKQLQEDPRTGWSTTSPEGVAAPWGVLGNCYGTPPDELNTLWGLNRCVGLVFGGIILEQGGHYHLGSSEKLPEAPPFRPPSWTALGQG